MRSKLGRSKEVQSIIDEVTKESFLDLYSKVDENLEEAEVEDMARVEDEAQMEGNDELTPF